MLCYIRSLKKEIEDRRKALLEEMKRLVEVVEKDKDYHLKMNVHLGAIKSGIDITMSFIHYIVDKVVDLYRDEEKE